MHPVKMIVADLDGTLLRGDKTVSERTTDALRRCRETGIKVVYATGRGERGAKLAVDEALFDGSILNNGACAVAGEDIVYSCTVPAEIIRPLFDECEARGLGAGVSRQREETRELYSGGFWQGEEAGKFWIEGCTAENTAFVKELLTDDFYLVIANDGVGMIMHRDATKSNAVAALARHWGIAREEIAAFGDDLNDIDMLQYAGTGIAMGNALDGVKAVAGEVCLSNEEDGLALWLIENL
jgi:hypothetical protein